MHLCKISAPQNKKKRIKASIGKKTRQIKNKDIGIRFASDLLIIQMPVGQCL